jgi:hypothetical protein
MYITDDTIITIQTFMNPPDLSIKNFLNTNSSAIGASSKLDIKVTVMFMILILFSDTDISWLSIS